MPEAVRASALMGLAELITSLGGDANAIFDRSGVHRDLLNQPDRFMSPYILVGTLNLAAEQLGRSDLGLLWGQRVDLQFLGPLQIVQANARTPREALLLGSQYLHTQTTVVRMSQVKLEPPGTELCRIETILLQDTPIELLAERQVVVQHRTLQNLCGEDYRPIAIWFRHPRMAPASAYVTAFGIEPDFEQPETGSVVHSRHLDRPIVAASSQLRDMALSYLRSLSPPGDVSFSEQVKTTIRILLQTGAGSASDAARSMGLHPRTLQRRLSAERITFEVLKDAVRKEEAERLLQDPALSLTEIALRLQYSAPSMLSRACQRWFGMSPSRYRQTMKARQSQA